MRIASYIIIVGPRNYRETHALNPVMGLPTMSAPLCQFGLTSYPISVGVKLRAQLCSYTAEYANLSYYVNGRHSPNESVMCQLMLSYYSFIDCLLY